MNSKQKVKKQKRKNLLVLIVVILIAAGGAAGYYFWSQQTPVSAQTTSDDLQTTQVRQGDLVISALGSGSLVAGQTANLSFPVSGTLGTLNVKVGDKVESGQELAVLDVDDLTSLQAKVSSAQLDLITAQQDLQDLQDNAGETLGQAQLDLADAQDAYGDAQSALKTSSMIRCDEDTTNAYYDLYLQYSQQYEKMEKNGWNDEQYIADVKPVIDARDTAYSNYVYCAGFTDYEISSSQATLLKTEAALKAAQEKLDKLTENSGVDPNDLAVAQNNVATAQLALEDAQKDLDGATMKAPFSGTILSVSAEVGDSVGTSTLITLADLAHPNVEFNVDETDMDNVKIGYDVQVVFDALPDQTFTGKVIQIDPQLTTFGSTQTLAGTASIDLGEDSSTLNLPEGLNASVEIIAGEAKDALLIPVEALKDLGDGEYAVFVVGSDGKPKLTVVQVGLMDLTYAQITDGLSLGDTVTTGIVETK